MIDMYDKIIIDNSLLPEEFKECGDIWLTKSFNNVLDRYKIDAEGQLWHKDLFKTYAQFQPINITKEIHFYTRLEEDVIFKANIQDGFLKSLEQII